MAHRRRFYLELVPKKLVAAIGAFVKELQHAFAAAFALWSSLRPWKKRWLVNILYGLVIEAGLLALDDTRLIVGAQNWALDLTMQGIAAMRPTTLLGSMTIIDVNEETWRNSRWGGGEPYRAPRDRVFDLIKSASNGTARYVIVDIIVEDPSNSDDESFAGQVENLVPQIVAKNQHVLFVRTIREPIFHVTRLAPEIRHSVLDRLVAAHPDRLHNVAPYFRVSRDGVLRDWQLWRAACRRDTAAGTGHWIILPSVQLAVQTYALVDRASKEMPRKAAAAWNAIAWDLANDSRPCIVEPDAASSVVTDDTEAQVNRRFVDSYQRWLSSLPRQHVPSNLKVADIEENDLNSRIFFRYGSPPPWPQVTIVPALTLIDSSPTGKPTELISRTVSAAEVVLIGQSFEAARDQHATPLGLMPGALVLANSISSMSDYGFLHRPGMVMQIVLQLISIVFIGFVLALFDSALGTVAIFAVFIVPFIFAANYLLSIAGLWLDFAVPILGIFGHQLFERFITRVEHPATHAQRLE